MKVALTGAAGFIGSDDETRARLGGYFAEVPLLVDAHVIEQGCCSGI
jgi:hypothetical protein